MYPNRRQVSNLGGVYTRRSNCEESSLPLPETVTVGKLARLVGGSCSVGVGEAVTAPMAARAEANAKLFMMNGYQAVQNVYAGDCGGFTRMKW